MIALALFASGCGGSPTEPSKPGDGAAPASNPAPSPNPAPTPAPTPTPEPVTRYTANVSVEHWFGTPLFTSPTFDVMRYADRLMLGAVTVPIVYQDDHSLIARTPEMNFSVVDETWTFNGVAGTAAGNLSKATMK